MTDDDNNFVFGKYKDKRNQIILVYFLSFFFSFFFFKG